MCGISGRAAGEGDFSKKKAGADQELQNKSTISIASERDLTMMLYTANFID